MSIFEPSPSYRPFKYPWAVDIAYKHSVDMYWDAHQIELQDDIRQWLTEGGMETPSVSHEDNKAIINKILNLFTEMDKTVGEGYTKLLPHVKNNEIRNMMLTFAAREVTHQRSYATLSEALGTPDSEWQVFSSYVEMQDKIDVMDLGEHDLSRPLNFAKALTKLLLSEGIGLFASFAILLNYKRQGLLMGFNDVNQWSLLDESEHVAGNIRTLQEVILQLTESEVVELGAFTKAITEKFVLAEHKFIDLVYKDHAPEDLDEEDLKDYIVYLARLREYQMGLIPLRDVPDNPLTWMEWLLTGKKHDNFFEKRVTDYSHGGLVGEIDYSVYKEFL